MARWKSASCPVATAGAGGACWWHRLVVPAWAVGWLSRAQGVGSRGGVVAAVGEEARDRFTVGGNSGRGHGGGDRLAGSGGNWVGFRAQLACPSSGVGPGASSAPVGRRQAVGDGTGRLTTYLALTRRGGDPVVTLRALVETWLPACWVWVWTGAEMARSCFGSRLPCDTRVQRLGPLPFWELLGPFELKTYGRNRAEIPW